MTLTRIHIIEYITEDKIIRGRRRTYDHHFVQREFWILRAAHSSTALAGLCSPGAGPGNIEQRRYPERFKDRVAFISLRRIQRDEWIAQAKNLAEGSPAKALHPDITLDKGVDKPPQTADKAAAYTKRETWKEVADFFVSFGSTTNQAGEENLQTRVHHSQAGVFNQWDGIVTQDLVSWMLHQANLAGELAPGEQADRFRYHGKEALRRTPALFG